MIKAILSFQFDLNLDAHGNIDPQFKPIQLLFADKSYTQNDYSKLIVKNDIFGIFYQHTSGFIEVSSIYSNFFLGRLKQSPFQTISYFKQQNEETQFLVAALFELDDELELFKESMEDLGHKLDDLFPELIKAKNLRKLDMIEKANEKILDELKFTLFQIERLSQLVKLQKAALIFKSKERREIMKVLREAPYSKRELKSIAEAINPNINIDVLLDPFLELNLLRRDWIVGKLKKKKVGYKTRRERVVRSLKGLKRTVTKQDKKEQTEEEEKKEAEEIKKELRLRGEYLFLVKDLVLARTPNEHILMLVKEADITLYNNYKKAVDDYFDTYDPLKQSEEDSVKFASLLLKPDMFDFFTLMRSNYYPLDKIPKILSEWADFKKIKEEWTHSHSKR